MPAVSPSSVLKLAVALASIITAVALVMVLRVPWLGLALQADTEQQSLLVRSFNVDSDVSSSVLTDVSLQPPLALLSIGNAGSASLSLRPDDLVEEPDLLGNNAAIAELFERQTRIHAMLQRESVILDLADAAGEKHQIVIEPSRRPFASLPFSFWVQVVVACASFLTGCWIWSLRQADWGARCFLVSGIGILLSAMSAAIYSSRELALDGGLFKALSAINFAGASLFGAAMAGLFLTYPKQLVQPKWLLGFTAALWGLALTHILERYAFFDYLFPDAYVSPQIILLEMTCIIAFTCCQWVATRGDPASRAVLRWLGMSIIVCSGLFIALFYVPVILGEPLVISQGYSFVFFLLIYLGIALGLRRYRLFDLGTWAFRITFYLSALLGFLLLDALIVTLLQLSLNISTGISLLVIGFGYLPLRDWLWRSTLGRNRGIEEKRFMEAMDIPFATEANGANLKWQQLLNAVFDPLEIVEGDAGLVAPQLVNEGVMLALPATSSVAAVTLKFCQGGKRLFSSDDLFFSGQLFRLLQHAEHSRDAYEKGRSQERQRIAQDLHDDIGARLLSSLHSEDLGSTRSSIRKTIADLRAVVGGLIGTQTPLPELMSALRFEASTRLEEGGLELDWPFSDVDETQLLVDYRFTKNLASIMREIISNVLVHAKASRVLITAVIEESMLLMTVCDNGSGISNHAVNGNGLSNIHSRTTAINGTITINSSTVGLHLHMAFPLTLQRAAGRAAKSATTL